MVPFLYLKIPQWWAESLHYMILLTFYYMILLTLHDFTLKLSLLLLHDFTDITWFYSDFPFFYYPLLTFAGSLKKQESSRKISISALLIMPKPLTVWITINCGKFWKRWEYQTTLPASWKTCMQVRKQQLELDMDNRLVPNRKGLRQTCMLSPRGTPLQYSSLKNPMEGAW